MRVRHAAVTLAVLVLTGPALAGCVSLGPLGDGDGWEVPWGARDATRLPDGTPYAGPNVTLLARVVDAGTGDAVRNATVNVQLVTGDLCGPGVLLPWHTWALTPTGNATYGPHTIPGPGGAAAFQYHVSAPGYAPAMRQVEWAPGPDATLEAPTIVLTPAAHVTVPAPEDARVAWWRADAPGAFEVHADGEADPTVLVPAGRVAGVVVDANGTRAAFTVDAPAFGHVRAEPAPVEPDANTTRVAVRVMRGEEPAAGATVLALDGNGEPVAVTTADGNGTAHVDVPEGARVTAHASYARGTLRASGELGVDGVTLALTRASCPAE